MWLQTTGASIYDAPHSDERVRRRRKQGIELYIIKGRQDGARRRFSLDVSSVSGTRCDVGEVRMSHGVASRDASSRVQSEHELKQVDGLEHEVR